MKLEKLKFKAGSIFSVTLEGCPPMILEDVSVYRLGLTEGMEIGEELFQKICTISGEESAKYAAGRMLAAGRKTELEIRQKLRQKGFEAESIDSAAEMFKKTGILNDEEYAIAYIKDAVNLKKYSVRMIRQKLYHKGIDREIVQELTAELDDFDQLYKLTESEKRKNPDKKGLERFRRRLVGKGFNLWDINKVLGEFEDET